MQPSRTTPDDAVLADADTPARKRSVTRRVPQQARGQQTLQAVLKTAGEEIERAGMDNLSTRRIAAAAGLWIGALYGYFPNKDSIVAVLGASWLEGVYAATDATHPRHGQTRDVFARHEPSMTFESTPVPARRPSHTFTEAAR